MLWERDDENEHSSFDLLDDHCCYEILRWLQLDDLCDLSRTCMRMHRLCSSQFKLEYPSKVIHFTGIENGTLVKEPNREKYIQSFEKSIQRLVLHGELLASNVGAVNRFYNQDKSTNGLIKEIQFTEWEKPLDSRNIGRPLADLLKNVETVTLDNVWINVDWYDSILQYTPNIKCLKVKFRCIFEERQNWLKTVYPNIKSFEYHTIERPNIDTLITFLQSNPSIQHFSLFSYSSEDVRFIAKNVKIHELFYEIFEHDIDVLMKELNALDEITEYQDIKLHLLIGGSCTASEDELVKALLPLQSNIVDLYFPDITIGEKLATTISKFENVRVLMLNKCQNKNVLAQIPNLEELYFARPIQDKEFDDIYDTMLTFVRTSVKLTKICFREHHVPLTKFDFAQFDQERMKLKGARKLKFYIKSDFDEMGNFYLVKRTFNLIEIIRSETEPPSNAHFTHQNCMFIDFSDVDRGFAYFV